MFEDYETTLKKYLRGSGVKFKIKRKGEEDKCFNIKAHIEI